MIAFTPGPWVACTDHDSAIYIAAGAWPLGTTICECKSSDNARLIAAAPEMYAALKALAEAADEFGFGDYAKIETYDTVDNALALLARIDGAA